MGFRRRIPESPKVDLTPMIDVVFLLLIFFMISTTFIEKPGLTIDLPQTGSDSIIKENKEVHVYLTDKGEIFLQRRKVTLDELTAQLRSYKPDQARQTTFLLMADRNALHGQVIRLMDIAKQAGFSQLAIATDPDRNTTSGQEAKEK